MASFVLTIFLSIILTQVHSAPSGCIELCNQSGGFNTQTSESLSAFETHAAMQSESLRKMHQNLQNQLRSPMNLDYTRPGNWTEYNQWKTDGGAGKVHEERGQFESGPAKIQYYKKNYSASFGSGDLKNGGINHNNLFNSQNLAGFNNEQFFNHQSDNFNGHTGSVENFSGQSGKQTAFGEDLSSRLSSLQIKMNQFSRQLSEFPMPTQTSSSLQSQINNLQNRVNRINSQIQQKNSHSENLQSTDINQNSELHQLQQLVRTYENHMHDLQNFINTYSKQTKHTVPTSQNIEYGQNLHTENMGVPVHKTEHHYEYNSHHEEKIQTSGVHIPTSQNYVIPEKNLQQETYVTHQNTHIPDQNTHVYRGDQIPLRIPLGSGNQYQNYREEHGQQSEYQRENSNHLGSDSHQHDVYTQNNGRYTGQPTVGKHIEEHWSASGHRSESTIPHQQIESNSAFERQRLERIRQQQQQQQQHYGSGSTHSGYQSSGSSSGFQQSNGQFHTGVIETSGQIPDCDNESHSQYQSSMRYKRGIDSGISQQTEDLSQQTQDFTQQSEDLTQQTQDFTQQSEDLTQQTQDFTQQSEDLSQQTQDFTQQSEDLSQQTQDFTQQNEDLSQQTQDFTQQNEDLSQQTQDFTQQNEDLSQQTQDFTQQSEGLSQKVVDVNNLNQQHRRTHEHGDNHDHDHEDRHRGDQGADNSSSNQSQNGLEFGNQRRHEHNHHHEHDHDHVDRHQHDRNNFDHHQYGGYSQNTEDLTQQTQSHGGLSQQQTGNLEFGQQTQQNRHHEHDHDHYNRHQHEDFSQQTQDLSQQTGNLEFGQQTQQNHHHEHDHDHYNRHQHEDFSQQTQDLSQQTGNLEFGQQTQQNHRHEHDHEHYNRHQHGDYIQQTHQQTGNLEFGQQTSDNLNQHSTNFGDFSQQSSANLEFGQNTHQPDNLNGNFGTKPAPKPVGRGQRLGNSETPDNEIIRPAGVKGGRKIYKPKIIIPDESAPVVGIEEQFQQAPGTQWHNEHRPADLTNENYQQSNLDISQSSVGNQTSNKTETTDNLFQPRLLEVYGGNGHYDVNHNDNIFSGIKPNPSVTLAPFGENDHWDIREKADDDYKRRENPIFQASPDLPYQIEDLPTTTKKPGFWNRVSQKITTTYEKAKDKVSDVIG